MSDEDEREGVPEAVPDAPEGAREGTVEGAAPGAEGKAGKTQAAPRKKMDKRKKMTIAAAAAIAVAIMGVGFWTWHLQPGFCNFMCHSPQDNYVASYYAGDPGTGVTNHAKAGMNCLSCHEATIDTQLREVATWIGDGYNMTEDGFLVTGKDLATKEFCTRSGCHNWDDVVESTWGFSGNDEKYNPHASHQDGSVTCSDCHKVHQTSQLYCAKCHDLTLPEGWEATGE